jgi:glycine/D-amino acid oxidase-like deaminating enzyme
MADDLKNIVIVGGGIIGCTSAYYLTRHPSFDPSKHKITLLEATRVASGASGKAGGLLALWAYPSSIVPLSYRLHKELSDEHGGIDRWGYRTVHCGQVDCVGRQLPEKSKDDGANAKGTNANGQTGAEGKADSVSLQKNPPTPKKRLGSAGVPKDLDWVSEQSLRAYDEMGDPSTTAQVHPKQFTESMAALAQEKGVTIQTGARVTSINYTASGDRVESVTYTTTSTGHEDTLPATDVLLAAGPWTRHIYPAAPIGALRAHSVTIRPSRDVSAYALFTHIQLPRQFPNRHQKGENGGQVVSPEIYARPHNEVCTSSRGARARNPTLLPPDRCSPSPTPFSLPVTR